jgi:hypothetical protein
MTANEALVYSREEMEAITGRIITAEEWRRFMHGRSCERAMMDVMNFYLDMLNMEAVSGPEYEE